MDISSAIMDPELGRSAFTVERLTYNRSSTGTSSRSHETEGRSSRNGGTVFIVSWKKQSILPDAQDPFAVFAGSIHLVILVPAVTVRDVYDGHVIGVRRAGKGDQAILI